MEEASSGSGNDDDHSVDNGGSGGGESWKYPYWPLLIYQLTIIHRQNHQVFNKTDKIGKATKTFLKNNK